MKRMFLAASINRSGPAMAPDIAKVLNKNPQDLKVAFITTAAEGSADPDKTWVDNDRNGLIKGGFNLFDYTITGKNIDQIKADLSSCDVIHVNGGNPFYLLLQMQKSGFDKWIKEEVESGRKIYSASSAGGVVMAPNIEAIQLPEYDTHAKMLSSFEGLGMVEFLIFPHWGNEKKRSKFFDHRLGMAYKEEGKIILLTNWQYIEVINDMYKIKEIEH